MDSSKDNRALGFQKNSELVQLFNYHLARLRESGLIAYMDHRYFPSDVTPENHEDPVGYIELGPDTLIFPFLVLQLGIVSAMALIGWEKLWKLSFLRN